MEVFKLHADAEKFGTLVLAHKDDWSKITPFLEGRRSVSEWDPIPVTVYRDPKFAKADAPLSDFPYLSPLDVFSERAVEALRDILSANGSLVPILSDEGSYFVFVTSTTLNALDESKSTLWRLTTGRVVDVKKHCFVSTPLINASIFKLAQLPFGRTYVTDKFVDRVNSTGLIGFRFESVWHKQEDVAKNST